MKRKIFIVSAVLLAVGAGCLHWYVGSKGQRPEFKDRSPGSFQARVVALISEGKPLAADPRYLVWDEQGNAEFERLAHETWTSPETISAAFQLLGNSKCTADTNALSLLVALHPKFVTRDVHLSAVEELLHGDNLARRQFAAMILQAPFFESTAWSEDLKRELVLPDRLRESVWHFVSTPDRQDPNVLLWHGGTYALLGHALTDPSDRRRLHALALDTSLGEPRNSQLVASLTDMRIRMPQALPEYVAMLVRDVAPELKQACARFVGLCLMDLSELPPQAMPEDVVQAVAEVLRSGPDSGVRIELALGIALSSPGPLHPALLEALSTGTPEAFRLQAWTRLAHEGLLWCSHEFLARAIERMETDSCVEVRLLLVKELRQLAGRDYCPFGGGRSRRSEELPSSIREAIRAGLRRLAHSDPSEAVRVEASRP